eukprot:GHVO01063529.1.p1 GENE.GHVO01063529.1~~GHVO01063529.1.p1  ORF type:complete len:176 (-),score=31.62 GHVO01063529.1:999-1526(-)
MIMEMMTMSMGLGRKKSSIPICLISKRLGRFPNCGGNMVSARHWTWRFRTRQHRLGRSAIHMHAAYTEALTKMTNALREAVPIETVVKASLKAFPETIPDNLDKWILNNEEGDPPGEKTKSIATSLRWAILEAYGMKARKSAGMDTTEKERRGIEVVPKELAEANPAMPKRRSTL